MSDKNNHTISTHLKMADDLPVSVNFDHQPAEKQTHDYPGCPAEVDLCEVFPQLDCPTYDLLPVLTKLAQTSLRAACWEYLETLRGYYDEH